MSKSSHQLPAGLLQPLPIPQRPWSHIAIDFNTDLPLSRGHTTILTVIDRFSKACRLIPLPKLPTALETTGSLCDHVFRFYGLADDIVSNRGPQFTSRVWSAFCLKLNINVSLTSGYHPQANGQVERLNQERTHFLIVIGIRPTGVAISFGPNMLRIPSVNQPQVSLLSNVYWVSNLPYSPGRGNLQICLPSTPGSNGLRESPTGSQVNKGAGSSSTASQSQLPSGSMGLAIDLWSTSCLPCRKLSPRYVGPFKILRQITPVSFRLALPANYRISPTLHVSLLKPASGSRGVEDQEEAGDQRAPPIIIDGEEVYRVQEVLDSSRRGRVVDWERFGPEERSWVNAEEILDPSITTDFHRAHLDKSAQRPRGRPRRRRGGGVALSQISSQWLPPITTRELLHQSTNCVCVCVCVFMWFMRKQICIMGIIYEYDGYYKEKVIYGDFFSVTIIKKAYKSNRISFFEKVKMQFFKSLLLGVGLGVGW